MLHYLGPLINVYHDSSFLPQDKVSEFAQMSSQQLLKETQKAAGDENLTAWHQTLIESGKEFRKVQEVNFVASILILSRMLLTESDCLATRWGT